MLSKPPSYQESVSHLSFSILFIQQQQEITLHHHPLSSRIIANLVDSPGVPIFSPSMGWDFSNLQRSEFMNSEYPWTMLYFLESALDILISFPDPVWNVLILFGI
jgi:hypothetical protein